MTTNTRRSFFSRALAAAAGLFAALWGGEAFARSNPVRLMKPTRYSLDPWEQRAVSASEAEVNPVPELKPRWRYVERFRVDGCEYEYEGEVWPRNWMAEGKPIVADGYTLHETIWPLGPEHERGEPICCGWHRLKRDQDQPGNWHCRADETIRCFVRVSHFSRKNELQRAPVLDYFEDTGTILFPTGNFAA